VAAASTPTISVVIACYNLGAFLDDAVASVLDQTRTDFEIIVVDDGSTDADTQALLDDYRPPRTTVVRAPHGGIAAARNRGVELARGKYLCFLDADDRLNPLYFEKTAAILDSEPSVAFVSSWLRAFGDETWEWKPERCDLQTLLSENTVLTAALVRKDAVVQAGGFDAAMPAQGDEDWDLWLTLVARGYRGVILREVLFHYRRRTGSISAECWHGPGHLPLARYRVQKHADSYRLHLHTLLMRQDSETAALLRQNDELERLITAELEPTIALRRRELESLHSRLADLAADAGRQAAADQQCRARDASLDEQRQRVRELEAALFTVSGEAAALRNSASWRITAPLRGVYGWWLRRWSAP
jgi:glycosyltransferase involved in cell wall biosynthesis